MWTLEGFSVFTPEEGDLIPKAKSVEQCIEACITSVRVANPVTSC